MGKVQGEGNHEAAKRLTDEEQAFVKSAKVKQAAAKTAPKSKKEADEVLEAEKVANSHPKNKSSQVRKQTKSDAPAPDALRDEMQP